MSSKDRKLFLRWLLLNCLAVVFLLALGISYGSKITGPSLVVIPVILAVGGFASLRAGRLCWNIDEYNTELANHETKWLTFWAWLAPMIGIMCTVFGFWKLLSAGGSDQELHNRIQSGGGVALVGTFTGIFVSIFITALQRMIEHEA